MKKFHLLTLAACLAVSIPSAALAVEKGAAKPGKEEKKEARHAARQYDANKNGTIDGEERESLRKAFEADKAGALKHFDANANGQLDDSEIDAIKFGHGGKGAKGAGKGKKLGAKKQNPV